MSEIKTGGPAFPYKMTKQEALNTIKLLAALESWSFSVQTRLPDHLYEAIVVQVEVLERIVLEQQA
jgi:hypothetical protein